MTTKEVRVYTDGACSKNPGPGGWGARIRYPNGRVKELGGAAKDTTNNRMELLAVIEALRNTKDDPKVFVVMDSEYVRQGITSWIHGWKARNWMTKAGKPVLNQDLWGDLDKLIRPGIRFGYTAGHAGDPDNERVDRIAFSFSQGKHIDLISDGIDHTPFSPLLDKPAKNKKLSGKKSGGPAVYLSYVDRKLMKYATWPECEREVKGKSGAKYKKCRSPEEERETLLKWGLSPDSFA